MTSLKWKIPMILIRAINRKNDYSSWNCCDDILFQNSVFKMLNFRQICILGYVYLWSHLRYNGWHKLIDFKIFINKQASLYPLMSQVQPANSRFSILEWVNDTLLLPLSKIEELGAGNVYCQLLDAAFPERVPLHKVKWEAKVEVEFLHNFKILQTSFQMLGIQKKINVEKLVKARYQDNLELVQWIKSFVENKIDYKEYEPLKRRNFARPYLGFANKKQFNVTCANKENLDGSFMKSSLKSNVSMRSSKMLASSSFLSNLKEAPMKSSNLILKTEPDEPRNKQSIKYPSSSSKNMQKRKNVGPSSYLARRTTPKTAYTHNNDYLKPTVVSNVDVIESEGSEDEVF